MKIDWTPEKKDACIQMLDEWIKKHRAYAGETVMQSDTCQIHAPLLIADLVDDIIKPEFEESDWQ